MELFYIERGCNSRMEIWERETKCKTTCMQAAFSTRTNRSQKNSQSCVPLRMHYFVSLSEFFLFSLSVSSSSVSLLLFLFRFTLSMHFSLSVSVCSSLYLCAFLSVAFIWSNFQLSHKIMRFLSPAEGENKVLSKILTIYALQLRAEQVYVSGKEKDRYHSVHKYLENHSVCPLVRIGTPPPCTPSPASKGGAHSPAGGGVGESQFGRLEKKPIALCQFRDR